MKTDDDKEEEEGSPPPPVVPFEACLKRTMAPANVEGFRSPALVVAGLRCRGDGYYGREESWSQQ